METNTKRLISAGVALFFTIVIAMDVVKNHGVSAESATGLHRLLNNMIGVPILLILAYSMFFSVTYIIVFEIERRGIIVGFCFGAAVIFLIAIVYSMGLTPEQQDKGALVLGGISFLFAIISTVLMVKDYVFAFKTRKYLKEVYKEEK